jgi:hypothetical protein
MIDDARASAQNKAHHPGQHEIIGVGRSYNGVSDRSAVVQNVFANFASVRRRSGLPEPEVPVFLNPLAMLLAGRERQKGSPLTETEVLEVRDSTLCTPMPISKAETYYREIYSKSPIPWLEPSNLWSEWQAIRDKIQL